MLPIAIKWDEWDEDKAEFVPRNGGKIRLEHSLISISKWESLTHKPFFDNGQDKKKAKTELEMLQYVQCMCIDEPPDISIISHMTTEQFNQVHDYIADKHTATWFRETPGSSKSPYNRRVMTSEVIYAEMIKYGIPFECQKWHVERLLTLIRVCQENNKDPQKMPRTAQMQQQAKLNAARRAKLGTTG